MTATTAATAAGAVRHWRSPDETVELLAEEQATGALYGDAGVLYLVDGLIVHAESNRAPDLAALLTGCGRIAPESWRETVRVHGPALRVGAALVEQHLLTRGELELCQLGALYDAASLVLDPTDPLCVFRPGVRHWLGPVAAVTADRLRREAARRREALDRIWPSAQLDTAPLARTHGRPLPYRPGRGQRRLLDHVDGRRTPAELARLLGHSAYGTTADVRRLAAAGLLVAAPRPAARHAATPVPVPEPAPVPAPRTAAGLHRRIPGATLAGAPVRTTAHPPPPAADRPPDPAAAHPLTVLDPDIALLTRVRTLLEARL